MAALSLLLAIVLSLPDGGGRSIVKIEDVNKTWPRKVGRWDSMPLGWMS